MAIILEELGVPYTNTYHQFPDLKQAPFEKVWINGRVPAIEDPNTGVKLGESGAIIEYLLATYDQNHGKLSYLAKVPERFYTQQWLHFQTSGQGPYFGQGAWFFKFHPEQIPSAQDRYRNEIDRVTGVLDRHLAATGDDYLVGGKFTYADAAFIPWYWMTDFILGEEKAEAIRSKHPHWQKWWKAVSTRPAVQKVYKEKSDAMAAGK